MSLFPLSGQILGSVQSTSAMFSVLKLFLLPVGGGIPAGVLLAQAKGVAWPVTAALYLVSDMVLALAFEPILRLLAWFVAKIPFLARFSAALKSAKGNLAKANNMAAQRKRERDRMATLLQQGFVAQSDLDLADTNYRDALAQVEVTQALVDQAGATLSSADPSSNRNSRPADSPKCLRRRPPASRRIC